MAKTPEIVRKVNAYREDRWECHNIGMYDGRFTPDRDEETVTKAFIAERMKNAVSRKKNAKHFPHSNYQVPLFPKLWVKSPTQASGELDKVVGVPVVAKGLRRRLKELPFDVRNLDPELREELAELVHRATLQPASTFMNSLRERLSAARAGSGGARVGGSYIQGAIFNPRTLIALLNIFRVNYNYFELRTYSSPCEQGPAAGADTPKVMLRALRIPGTDERIEIAPTERRTPERKTPAMRHGIEAFVRRKTGKADAPDLHRVIYRPWLYAGTKVGARLDSSCGRRVLRKTQTTTLVPAVTEPTSGV